MAMILSTELDHRFSKTFFVVEAPGDTSFLLWKNWYDNPDPKFPKLIRSWKDEGRGAMIHVGDIDNRPIWMSVFWTLINDKRVAFYNITSAVNDTKQVEEWFDEHMDLRKKGYYMKSSDFSDCLSALQRAQQKGE